ncbi:SDR family oxidoreductase [Bacillus sp. 165]|uniref:SDR family oxidoreductase n=1 Tax=Bacillus sp. 165 TaxID=1529117 RepID=UPI001ADA46B3|nr:SDR family oxidoreductase [Bacillus sp. 165]MBO9129509.1 SDR family oxidoreductase [Bacillus sp. 165]
MKNKICLITGGNSGIGRATALELAKMGATVVILCRSREKGQEAVRDIIAQSGNHSVHLLIADLSSQQQVRQAADKFKEAFNKLDVLINNAAVFLPKRSETEDGIETTFATNYLSHFLLTHLLLDSLEASGEGRVINVASKHSGIKMNFDDLMTKNNYTFFKAVGPTKLALILFTKELAKKLEGRPITVNSLHPGIIKTNIMHELPWILRTIFKLTSASTEKGAKTPVYLASSPEVKGVSGTFFSNRKPAETTAAANDENAAKKLWDISMSLLRPDVLK